VNKEKKQKVVIAGGSGFLGQALAHSLLADKYDVVLLEEGEIKSVGCWAG
jgi:nucleoside-diphosphate-sugar epimerase